MAPIRAWAPVPDPRLPAATARAIVVERARRRVVCFRAFKPLTRHPCSRPFGRVPSDSLRSDFANGPKRSTPHLRGRSLPCCRACNRVGIARGGESAVRLPAAGELVASRAAVRAAPSPHARVVRIMNQFRPDSQFQIVLAVKARRGSDGGWWYMLSLPGRPNGQRGWVRGDLVDLQPARNRIVVHVRTRTIEVRRIADGKRCSVMSSLWASRAPRRRSGATSMCRRALLLAIRSSAPSSWRRVRIRS